MAALSPYSSKIVEDNAFLYFPMNEEYGGITDIVQGLTMAGVGSRGYRAPSASGMRHCINLGVDGYFTTLSDHFIKSGTRMAFEFWLSFVSMPPDVAFISQRNESYGIFVIGSTGQLVLSVRSAGGTDVYFAYDIDGFNDGEFHHYFLNLDGSSVQFYIDGVLIDSDTQAFSMNWIPARTTIGTGLSGNTPDNRFWARRIDGFAFYKTSLTLGQIQDHWLLGVSPTIEFAGPKEIPLNIPMYYGKGSRSAELQGTITMDATLNQDLVFTNRVQPWWNYSYPYRRRISYQAPPSGIKAGHPMYVTLSKSLYLNGKTRSDLLDVTVLYLKSQQPDVWVELPSTIDMDNDSINVSFNLAKDIENDGYSDGEYFIYYGGKSSSRLNVGAGPSIEDQYHIELYPYSTGLDYTRPGVDWVDGKSKTDNAKVTLRFEGDRVQLWSRLGPDQGIAEVQINDSEWAPIDLFSRVEQATAVLSMTGLNADVNYLRFRSTGQNNPSSQGNGINFIKMKYGKHSTFSDVREETDESRVWNSTLGGM